MAFKLKKFNILGTKHNKPPLNYKSPLKQNESTKAALMDAFKKGGSYALSQSRLADLAKRYLLPVSIVSSLYGMYKSGQEGSGGKWGYEPNPNYDPASGKGQHSDDEWTEDGTHGGTAQWRKRKPMFHESTESQKESYKNLEKKLSDINKSNKERIANLPPTFPKKKEIITHDYSYNPNDEISLLQGATSNQDGTINFGEKTISQEAYQSLMDKHNI